MREHPITASFSHVLRRLTLFNSLGALSIHALAIMATWGNWRSLGWICLGAIILMLANTWFTLVLLPKRGMTMAETARSVVNTLVGVGIYHLIGWPLASWLWLPFVAVSFDGFNRKLGWAILLGVAACYDVAALLDGISWRLPLTFTALAVVCRLLAETRLQILRDMVDRSEQQRADLDQARTSVELANERLRAEMKLRTQAELDLRQAQRLEAVGRLASGVAHEINTPLQFITDSVRFAREATTAMIPVLERCDAIVRAKTSGVSAEALREIDEALKAVELEYMRVELPDALEDALGGLARVAAIVASMKEFAHPVQQAKALVDINHAVTTTLAVAAHEYKYVADVVTDFGQIEAVHGRAGEIHQVLLNLVVNAAHAIEDVVKTGGPRGKISIRTRSEGDDVVIAIGDTGRGIPASVQEKVYDPFFTTKEVGRGSGQGLAIARSIVVGKHGGKLTFESTESVGTTFVVRLPIRPPSSSHGQAA